MISTLFLRIVSDSRKMSIAKKMKNICYEKNLFPIEIVGIILSFVPPSFPKYKHNLCSTGLNIISCEDREPIKKLVTQIVQSYKKHSFTPILFTDKSSFSNITDVNKFTPTAWDEFSESVQDEFMNHTTKRTKYVLFMDDPPDDFLRHCNWTNIVFHGNTLILPLYLIKSWSKIPPSIWVVVDNFYTREIDGLWGRYNRDCVIREEIRELLRFENKFLVQRSENFIYQEGCSKSPSNEDEGEYLQDQGVEEPKRVQKSSNYVTESSLYWIDIGDIYQDIGQIILV